MMTNNACRDDPLMMLLNARGYHPVVLPRAAVSPLDLYIYDADQLKLWWNLRKALPAGALPKEKPLAQADIEHTQMRRKNVLGAVSFLKSALAALGVSGEPALNLGFAKGRDVSFRFTGVTSRGQMPGDVAAAIRNGIDTSGLPEDALRLGKVHLAYEYAYAETLDMTVGTQAEGNAKLSGLDLTGVVSAGAEAKISLIDGTTIRFSRPGGPVAFACKLAQLRRQRDGSFRLDWREAAGLGAAPVEGEAAPYMLTRGEILTVGEAAAP